MKDFIRGCFLTKLQLHLEVQRRTFGFLKFSKLFFILIISADPHISHIKTHMKLKRGYHISKHHD